MTTLYGDGVTREETGQLAQGILALAEDAAEFGWHVLSECPDEAACPIHGRNEVSACPDCDLPEPHERGTECPVYEWTPDDIWGPRP